MGSATQVASRHHDRVGVLDDLVEILDALAGFEYFDMIITSGRAEDSPYGLHVKAGTNKGDRQNLELFVAQRV